MKDAAEETEVVGVIEVVHVKGIEGLSTTNKAKLNNYDVETIEFFSRQLCRVIMSKIPESKQSSEHYTTIESTVP